MTKKGAVKSTGNPTRIGTIIGSKTDLPQMLPGNRLLKDLVAKGKIEIVFKRVISVHRNPVQFLRFMKKIAKENNIDYLILGAGMSAHLPGCGDAILRFFGNDHIKVLAVGFENKKDDNCMFAINSIVGVPENQMLFCGTGEEGYLNAVKFPLLSKKARKKATKPIVVPPKRKALTLNVDKEIKMGEKLKKEKEAKK